MTTQHGWPKQNKFMAKLYSINMPSVFSGESDAKIN